MNEMNPTEIEHAGRTWYRTGKRGHDARTGAPSAEYAAYGTDGAERLWTDAAGNVTTENA